MYHFIYHITYKYKKNKVINKINVELKHLLKTDGFSNITEAIGTEV